MNLYHLDLLFSPKDYVDILDGIMPTEKRLDNLVCEVGFNYFFPANPDSSNYCLPFF